MSEKTTDHGTAPEPRRPRCQECWDIKRTRAQALAVDDRRTAEKMTRAMGVHIWEAHA
ncbi:hypothetical protein [Streptomyces albireticuli]|uniref:hypothetical protein n=1 Tax=Streptomyces albireticuli TaxID=1940 RepID=UPI0036BE8A25